MAERTEVYLGRIVIDNVEIREVRGGVVFYEVSTSRNPELSQFSSETQDLFLNRVAPFGSPFHFFYKRMFIESEKEFAKAQKDSRSTL